MGKLKDFVPSVDQVLKKPGLWSNPWAIVPNQIQHGRSEQKDDRVTKAKAAEYKATHPDPIIPSRSSTDITGAQEAAKRRRTGRISTVLSDTETLG